MDGNDVATGGSVIALLLALLALLREHLRNRRHDNRNKDQVTMTEREADKAERIAKEQGAIAAVTVLGGVIDDLREELTRRSDDCDEQRAQDRAQCDREIAAVRADIAAVARRTRDLLPEDTTGKHELVAIEARQRSSPPPPPPRRIPPPPRKPRV